MASLEGEVMHLVYEHKTMGRKLVPNGISILDEEGIVMIISGNPDIRMFTKAIKPGCTSVDLYKMDLLPEAEKVAAAKEVEKLEAGGQVEVPWKVFLGHEWEGHTFDELLILTPENAVSNPAANSETKLA